MPRATHRPSREKYVALHVDHQWNGMTEISAAFWLANTAWPGRCGSACFCQKIWLLGLKHGGCSTLPVIQLRIWNPLRNHKWLQPPSHWGTGIGWTKNHGGEPWSAITVRTIIDHSSRIAVIRIYPRQVHLMPCHTMTGWQVGGPHHGRHLSTPIRGLLQLGPLPGLKDTGATVSPSRFSLIYWWTRAGPVATPQSNSSRFLEMQISLVSLLD